MMWIHWRFCACAIRLSDTGEIRCCWSFPNYSERAFRAGVVNALVHRDYTRQGAVHVQWREDRVETSSPGGFPEGVHLGSLLVTPPQPRNPRLADSFMRLGLVERTGRGRGAYYRLADRCREESGSFETET